MKTLNEVREVMIRTGEALNRPTAVGQKKPRPRWAWTVKGEYCDAGEWFNDNEQHAR